MVEKAEIPIRFESFENPELMAQTLEAVAEGVTRMNVIWGDAAARLGEDPPCCVSCLVDDYGLVYVDPSERKCAAACQRLDCAPVLLEHGRATCFDLACYFAAIWRREGKPCNVQIDPVIDAYGYPIPGEYHAYCRFADGSARDPSEELRDYMQHGKKADCDCADPASPPQLEVGGCSTGQCGIQAMTRGNVRTAPANTGCPTDPASPFGGNCLG